MSAILEAVKLEQQRIKEQRSRAPWFAVVVFILAYGIAGTVDYNDAKAQEREYLAAKKAKRSQDQPARIWSKRCQREGKRILAVQSDGGRWKISCVYATGART